MPTKSRFGADFALFPDHDGGAVTASSRVASMAAADGSLVWSVLQFGADPNATRDSTAELQTALDAMKAYAVPGQPSGLLGPEVNRGGLTLDLEGGSYLVSKQLEMPFGGNVRVCCGTIVAAESFPSDAYLLHVGGGAATELVVLDHLTFDANYTGGGLYVDNVLRATLDSLYVVRFATAGVFISQGHEVHLTDSFLGAYWWNSRPSNLSELTGTAVVVSGQDHWVSDCTIFSAHTGIYASGGALLITGVHAYPGGLGPALYLAADAGTSSIRALGNYWDGRGVVVETPITGVQIKDSLFLQGTGVSINVTSDDAVIQGLEVEGNHFRSPGHADAPPDLQPNITFSIANVRGSVGFVSDSYVRNNAADRDVFEVRSSDFTNSILVPAPANVSSATFTLPLNDSFAFPSANFLPTVSSLTAHFAPPPIPATSSPLPPSSSPAIALAAYALSVLDGQAKVYVETIPAGSIFPDGARIIFSVGASQLRGPAIG